MSRIAAARKRIEAIAVQLAEIIDTGERDPRRSEVLDMEEAVLELGRALVGRTVPPAAQVPSPAAAATVDTPASTDAPDALSKVLGLVAEPEVDRIVRCGARDGKNGLPCIKKHGHEDELHSTGWRTFREPKRRKRAGHGV